MNRIDPADEAQLFATIDRWVTREVAPKVKEYDHADRWPAEIVEQMKELGLFGATVSAEYGGLGLPATTYAQIVMKISAVWMAITGIFNSHLMLALAIEKFGTEPQKRRWLPLLASGEIRGGLALTEPDAGTDLQAIRMTARREGDLPDPTTLTVRFDHPEPCITFHVSSGRDVTRGPDGLFHVTETEWDGIRGMAGDGARCTQPTQPGSSADSP